jgi:hypothetical protein
MFPDVDADAEPVAFALDLDEGRVRMVTVVPAAVLSIATDAAGRASAGLGGGGQ